MPAHIIPWQGTTFISQQLFRLVGVLQQEIQIITPQSQFSKMSRASPVRSMILQALLN
jgi:hypothetical protein